MTSKETRCTLSCFAYVYFTVSSPVRHSLPQYRLQPLFGSEMNGRCTSISGDNNNICNGTSVLNDGIIPALSGVSDDPQSQWADQLFTMGRTMTGTARVILSFEVERAIYNRLELAVFNCPGQGIYTPVVNVYVDFSFRPERSDSTIGFFNTNRSLLSTSCDHLIKFCVQFSGSVSVPYFNLEFPHQDNSNSSFVFLGEVTFLRNAAEPCGPPELITMPVGKYKTCK